MALTRVGRKFIDVDIVGELNNFDWYAARWTEDKLIASSPFRSDKSPSFFMNLTGEHAGTWNDSGADEDSFATGNLVTLLAHLRNESFQESEEYLLALYDVDYRYDELTIDVPELKLDTSKYVPEVVLENHPWIYSPYLASRGISEETQLLYGIRATKEEVAFPWRSVNGYLVTIKYRKTQDKRFFYLKGGNPVKENIFGIDLVYKYNTKVAVIGEAEVDAMTWTERKFTRHTNSKIVGLAVGGVTLTDEQAELIIKSPIEKLVINADNDKAGQRLRKSIETKLAGKVELYFVNIPDPYKDANELHTSKDSHLLDKIRPTRISALGGLDIL